jgi:nitrogenase molybdenum-iron protein alpha/beta subunit
VLSMRQSYRMIPVYTADVSGVCSALYELGGMTVMHDPSGCNSTYNTHDEIRWYDQDSLIFISGLTEIDAIMGVALSKGQQAQGKGGGTVPA